MQKMRYLEGLTKHYTFIDTPKPIRLVANPFKTSQGWSGTDSAFLPAGAWRIDNWTLLLTKDFPNSPAFKLAIVWDDELLDIDKVTIEFHDVNFGEGVAGVAGQAVIVNGFSGLGLTQIESIISAIDNVSTRLSSVVHRTVAIDGDLYNVPLILKEGSFLNVGGGSVFALSDCNLSVQPYGMLGSRFILSGKFFLNVTSTSVSVRGRLYGVENETTIVSDLFRFTHSNSMVNFLCLVEGSGDFSNVSSVVLEGSILGLPDV